MPQELPNIVSSTECLKKVRHFNKTSEVTGFKDNFLGGQPN